MEYIIKYGVLAAALCVASVTDLKRMIIPNTACVVILVAGLIHCNWLMSALGLIAVSCLFLCLRGRIGGGDIKLAAALGFFFGVWHTAAMLIIAMSLALIYCALMKSKTVPMAPFFALGSFIILL
ncbi:peptidase A24 [Clostridia bacterium]|nr:peptidase A24 [Clostridia bacterium]GHV36309.1 peptidase A24 [Clostridia bacterium]